MFGSKAKRMPKGPFREPHGDLSPRSGGEVKVILAIYAILLATGLANLYSASLGGAFFFSQFQNAIVGMVLFVLFGWFIPLRAINDYAYIVYGIAVAMLVVVFFTGHISGGSQRWIKLGPITGQPSEFAKIAVAIVVARYFHFQTQSMDFRLRDLWVIGTLLLVVFLLVFEQPDLGTAGVCLMIGVAQILALRLDKRSVMLAAGSALSVAIAAWFFFLHDYQKNRVLMLFNANLDPHGKGYNSLQSLVAVGSGQALGKGFMQGTQTQLQFLPARHTDFVFSVFAEEHGFWAAGGVFVLFAILTHLALNIARSGRDTFSSMLGIGIAAYIYIQFVINVAMVLGIFPVVGMPLPFFSHGGSALLVMSMALGMLISIHRNSNSLKSDRL